MGEAAGNIALRLDALRDPLRLTLLYCLSIILLGLPVVLTFDPTGKYGLFAGLLLAASAFMVPIGIFLALPRRWGMGLFALESLLLWILAVPSAGPTAIYTDFVLWTTLEFPMYLFELTGLLAPRGSLPLPRRPPATPLLVVWILLYLLTFGIGIFHESEDPMFTYGPVLKTLAYFIWPVPLLIVLRNVVRRIALATDIAPRQPGAPA